VTEGVSGMGRPWTVASAFSAGRGSQCIQHAADARQKDAKPSRRTRTFLKKAELNRTGYQARCALTLDVGSERRTVLERGGEVGVLDPGGQTGDVDLGLVQVRVCLGLVTGHGGSQR
jgi:hypothetical protein